MVLQSTRRSFECMLAVLLLNGRCIGRWAVFVLRFSASSMMIDRGVFVGAAAMDLARPSVLALISSIGSDSCLLRLC